MVGDSLIAPGCSIVPCPIMPLCPMVGSAQDEDESDCDRRPKASLVS